MWKDELQKIILEKKQYGEIINTGASQDEIILLKEKAEKELSAIIPKEYLEFLEVVNGIEFNGYIIYGIDQELLKNEANQRINGLIENNLIWYENEWQKAFIFLGESDIAWYVFDIEKGKYSELDNPSGSFIKDYDNYDDMLEEILIKSLN